MQIAGRGKHNIRILIFLVVVCFLSLIALAAIELLIDKPSDDGADGKTTSGSSSNAGGGQGGGNSNTGGVELPTTAGSGNTTAGNTSSGGNVTTNNTGATGNTTATGGATNTGGTPNSGNTVTPTTGATEPLDKPPDPSIKAELVRTYIENFVRDHTMLEQPAPSELSGNYFPPNTQILAVHVHGVSVTMDFSTEMLAWAHRPEVFDQWQQELIVGIFEVAPALANFHVRVMDEKGNLRPLNDFLKIPADKKPRDRAPTLPE